LEYAIIVDKTGRQDISELLEKKFSSCVGFCGAMESVSSDMKLYDKRGKFLCPMPKADSRESFKINLSTEPTSDKTRQEDDELAKLKLNISEKEKEIVVLKSLVTEKNNSIKKIKYELHQSETVNWCTTRELSKYKTVSLWMKKQVAEACVICYESVADKPCVFRICCGVNVICNICAEKFSKCVICRSDNPKDLVI
jgi:hypothetical protein